MSDKNTSIIDSIRMLALNRECYREVFDPGAADAIIVQEENSFKNFHYIKQLESDAIISAYPEKVFTINTDDCATGLLRGLYTSLPQTRFNSKLYTAVPYFDYPNELIFSKGGMTPVSSILASWRGNIKSNVIRREMVELFANDRRFCIQKTKSWLDHEYDEKQAYVDLMRASKFILCPAGWAPVSFRIYESMAMGKCPVIIADNFVPPEGPDWKNFALFFPENKLKDLPSFLLMHEHQAEELGQNALNAWQQYFSSRVITKYYANALVQLIELTPKTVKKKELERWRSIEMYWTNKWTLPQRILTRLSKLKERLSPLSRKVEI